MARIEDARDAEDMVYEYYREHFPLGPEPINFDTHKQGYTWIVKYNLLSVTDSKEYEAHINARTGNMLRIR